MKNIGWRWVVLLVMLVALLSSMVACAKAQPSDQVPLQQADTVSISSFTTSAASISAGQPATLSWNVSGANLVTIDPGIGNVNPSGSKEVSPSETTTYTLSAISDTNSKVASVKITVVPVTTTPADLVITDVTIAGSEVSYKIKNVGETTAKQSQTFLYYDDVKASNDFVDTLAPGEERIQSFSNYTIPLSQQTVATTTYGKVADKGIIITVCADEENTAGENNKTNNCTYILWGNKPKYDFVQNAHIAEWRSNKGRLTWPMVAEDTGGAAFVYHRTLEDGSIYYTDRCLATYPRNVADGVIQGIYGELYAKAVTHESRLIEMEVPIHAKFIAKLGFAQGAESSNGVKATFGIVDPTGTTVFLKSADVYYDGKLDNFEVDLSKYAGQKVYYILRAEANGPASFDWLLWLDPQIIQE